VDNFTKLETLKQSLVIMNMPRCRHTSWLSTNYSVSILYSFSDTMLGSNRLRIIKLLLRNYFVWVTSFLHALQTLTVYEAVYSECIVTSQTSTCRWGRLTLIDCMAESSMSLAQTEMKRALGETQTLRAGCSKAEPKNFAPPQNPFRGRRTAKI